MARKSRANNRREEILTTTMRVLAFEGEASVTMRSIADRVGIRLSTLQYYFPTRRELLRDTIEQCIGSVVRQMDEMIHDSSTDPGKLLHKALKVHLKTSRDPFVSKFFAAFWALAAHDSEAEELLNEVYERDCQRYAKLIQMASPKLSGKVCADRAVLILAQLEGLVLFVTPGKLRAPRVRMIEKELADLVDRAILAS